MASTLDPSERHTLTCPKCTTAYGLDTLDADRVYVCARCNQVVLNAGKSFETLRDRPAAVYLYGFGLRSEPHVAATGRLGRYSLRGELGRGGMGVVYRAWDPELSRFVALKVLLAGEHAGVQELERFLREARAAAQLDHPHIVRVLDIDRDDERAFFTMELVDGPSLADVVDAWGPRPVHEAVRIVASIARALHEAHRRGLLHRDVKPGNVMLQTDGTALLTDFGLVTAVREVDARITRTGQVLGTPAYMAPEQAMEDANSLTAKADQYALGAVLYESVGGSPPYDGTAMDVLMGLVTGPPKSIAQRVPSLPHDVVVMIERAMDRDPNRRYESALAFAEDLERWLAGKPILARAPTVTYRGRLWLRRHRREITLVLSGVLALVVGGVGFQGWSEAQVLAAAQQRETSAADRWEQADVRIQALHDAADVSSASQAFAAFIEDPEHRGTAVVAQAWLSQGHRAQRAGNLDDAVHAYGVSYVEARSVEAQQTALLALAATFEQQWRFDALGVVVEALADADDPRIGPWRARAHLARGDVVRALAALNPDDPSFPVLQALTTVEPLPFSGRIFGVRGTEHVLFADASGAVEEVAMEPGLPVVRSFRFPGRLPGSVFTAAVDPLTLVTADEGGDGVATAWQLDGDGVLRALQQWQRGRVGEAMLTDDGLLVGVGPYGRELLLVDLATGALRHPVPVIDAAASDVLGMLAMDLDSDGIEEVLVASGAWWSYDLRVLSQDLQPITRRKLGLISDLRAVDSDPPSVLVAKSDAYPSRKVFAPDNTFGVPSGVYRMALRGGELVDEGFWANPIPHEGRSCTVGNAWLGDVDGDGADDVVAWAHDTVHGTQTLIWRAVGESWVLVPLGGMTVVSVANLDDDPAMELLVDMGSDSGGLMVLGLGDQQRVVPPARTVDAEPVPRGDDPVALRVWERAEQLVRMGLLESGASQLEDLAGWTTDRLLGRRAELRAGQIWEAVGDDTRASERFAAAATDPLLADEALDSAALALEREHRFGEALEAVRGRSTPTARAIRERLASFVEDSRTVVLDFSAGVPDGVQILDPVAARRDAEPGLQLEVLADDDAVLQWPFHWDGRHLTLDVELTLERLEWAAGIAVSVQDRGGQRLAVVAQGWGGGAILEHELGCFSTLLHTVPARRQQVGGPTANQPLRFVLDVTPATGDVLCAVTEADGDVVHRERLRLLGPVSPGEWTLTVAATGSAGLAVPMMASVRLTSVTLTGDGLRGRAGPSTDPFIAAVVAGDSEGALLVQAPDTPAGAVWRAAVLADAGRWDEGVAALGQAVGTEVGDREVLHLLRSRAASFGPVMSEVAAGSFAEWFDRAWSGAMYAHVGDPVVQRALVTQLGGLEQPQDAVGRHAEMRRAALLIARASAWSAQGEFGAARRDLRVATEQVMARGEEPADQDSFEIRARLSEAHRDMAVAEFGAGRRDSALRWARESLDVASSRDIAVDALKVLPALQGVWDEPDWREVHVEPR